MTTFDTIAYLQSLRHQVTEVRILRESPYLQLNGKGRGKFVGKTVFGYYDNQHYDKLVADIQPYENDPETKGIYTTIQRCDPALLARASNRLKQAGDNTTTSDGNITHFVAFPIDVDSGCASGISATDAELETARGVASQIAEALQSLGIPVVKAKSGNGWHILIYLAELLEVTEDTTHRFKHCGDVIVSLWGGDATVYNPSRVWKLYGTTAKKGDATVDRPHRKAQILEPTDPAEIERVSFDTLEKAILSLEPAETTTTETDTDSMQSEKKRARKGTGKRLPPLNSRDDLERLARECGAELQGNWQTKPDYEACKTHCPLCHREKCGVISYSASGECGYKCHTNTCKGRNFQDLYESAGYSKAPEQKASPGGKRDGAGRKSNAEKAASIELPKTMNGKPLLSLYQVEKIDGETIISERSREVVSNDVVKLLWGNTLTEQRIYRRGTELGTLRRGTDTLQFTKLDADAMQGVIARVCTLVRERDGRPTAIANPPLWLGVDILKNQNIDDVSEVRVVMTHPFWNGSEIIRQPGYDPKSQVFLDNEGVNYEIDTGSHTAESDLQNFRELLSDFPFKEDSDFENTMAYMLTLILRQGLEMGEAAPLVDVTAPREGVGKSLLAETVTTAVTGRKPITRTLGSTKEEVEKGVGAALRGAPEVVLFDNVDSDKRLDSGILASVVTQPNRAFRILGISEEMFYENRATILYTGSNIEVTPELAKRMIAIRLYDTGEAEKDRKVKIEGLLAYTEARHPELISALLRMVQRWIESGAIEAPKNLHRMRQWSRVVHGVMLANGFGEYFMRNFDDVMRDADPEFTAWANGFKQIVVQLGGEKATTGWSVKDVFKILSHTDNVYSHEDDIGGKSFTRLAKGDNILGEFIGQCKNDKSRSITLGKLLRKKTGNVHGEWELVDTYMSDRGNRKIYALKWRGDASNDPTSPPENDPNADDPVECPVPSQISISHIEGKLLAALDGKPTSSFEAESLAAITGADTEDLPHLIQKLKAAGLLEKQAHQGEECYFATNLSECRSAEVAEVPF